LYKTWVLASWRLAALLCFVPVPAKAKKQNPTPHTILRYYKAVLRGKTQLPSQKGLLLELEFCVICVGTSSPSPLL
jgi:hypothetical protein